MPYLQNHPTDTRRISIVIPVYNSEETVGSLVERLLDLYAGEDLEIVLVDDASQDQSAEICQGLSEQHVNSVVFVQLARNFGEHNAVMAGLSHARGGQVVIMDDDFQNPPEAVRLLLDEMAARDYDVVYSIYGRKRHNLWRNAGSWFNNLIGTLMLGKPYKLYLSSFKIISRFAVDQILSYRGPFPYVDGLLLQSISRIGTVEVPHQERSVGKSSYTIAKLAGLWLNTFTNFSVLPLRVAFCLGLFGFLSGLVLVSILIYERLAQSSLPTGFLLLMATIILFSSAILVVSGLVGEYIGRVLLNVNGRPQFVVRRVIASGAERTEEVSRLERR